MAFDQQLFSYSSEILSAPSRDQVASVALREGGFYFWGHLAMSGDVFGSYNHVCVVGMGFCCWQLMGGCVILDSFQPGMLLNTI